MSRNSVILNILLLLFLVLRLKYYTHSLKYIYSLLYVCIIFFVTAQIKARISDHQSWKNQGQGFGPWSRDAHQVVSPANSG